MHTILRSNILIFTVKVFVLRKWRIVFFSYYAEIVKGTVKLNGFNTHNHQCVFGITDSDVNLSAGCKPWSNAMEILDEKDGVDTELLVYVMTLINKVGTGVMTALKVLWLRLACGNLHF